MIEAHGGCLVQLQPLAVTPPSSAPPLVPYHYVKGGANVDFLPGVSRLTRYNAAEGVLSEAESAKGAPPKLASSAEQLKPYANVLGLCCLAKADSESLAAVHAAVVRAAAKAPPAFD